MKFVTQDYYGILGVSPQAGPDELKRAWRVARQSFRPDSPAIHSLYSPEEAEAIAGKIDEAFRILTDPEVARRYAKYHRTDRPGSAIPRDPNTFFDQVHEPAAQGPLERLGADARSTPARPVASARPAAPPVVRPPAPPPPARRPTPLATPAAVVPVRRSTPESRLAALAPARPVVAVAAQPATPDLLDRAAPLDALEEVQDDAIPAPAPSGDPFDAARTARILAALEQEDADLDPAAEPIIAPALAAAALPRLAPMPAGPAVVPPPLPAAPVRRVAEPAAARPVPAVASVAPIPAVAAWPSPSVAAAAVAPTAMVAAPAAATSSSPPAAGAPPRPEIQPPRLPGAELPSPSPEVEGALAADEHRGRRWTRDTVKVRAVGALEVTPLTPEDIAALEAECGGMGGAFLQAARRQLGVSVEDIAIRTKIMTQMIRWIEGDSLSNLPAKVYLKGYLQQITRLLRLPPETIDRYLNHHRL